MSAVDIINEVAVKHGLTPDDVTQPAPRGSPAHYRAKQEAARRIYQTTTFTQAKIAQLLRVSDRTIDNYIEDIRRPRTKATGRRHCKTGIPNQVQRPTERTPSPTQIEARARLNALYAARAREANT